MIEPQPSQTGQTKSRTDVIEQIGQELHDMEQVQAGFNLTYLHFHEKSELVMYPNRSLLIGR